MSTATTSQGELARDGVGDRAALSEGESNTFTAFKRCSQLEQETAATWFICPLFICTSMVEFSCLRRIPLFANLHDDQFAFAQHGVERWLEANDILTAEGDCGAFFWVLLEGEIHCTKRVGDRQVPWITYQPNSYFGHELILLERPVLATARARSCCRLVQFDTTGFWKMLELCPSVTHDLMVSTTQRSQSLDALSLRAQKLMSLGTLTSGLAQELYPPAQASRAAVQKLQKKFELLQSLALRITHTLTPDQQACLIEIQQDVLRQGAIALAQSPDAAYVSQPKPVAEVDSWLQAHGVGDRPYRDYLASTLLRAGLGTAWLNKITAVPDCAFADVLLWIATTLTGMIQVDEIERSTLHISQLVQAAKDYTYLDQAPLQEMDIHDGLENTLRVLSRRLGSHVVVERAYDRSLPPICVYGGDLNQVWTHLIENAIDSMETLDAPGHLQIHTYQSEGDLVVEIIDSGVGIPLEAQPHIFKQFFTTKRGGTGTGLGLPIAQRVIKEQHRGQITVDSQPGRTCVQVSLPMNLTETMLMSPNLQVAYP